GVGAGCLLGGPLRLPLGLLFLGGRCGPGVLCDGLSAQPGGDVAGGLGDALGDEDDLVGAQVVSFAEIEEQDELVLDLGRIPGSGVPGGVLRLAVLDGHIAAGHATSSLSELQLSQAQKGGCTSSGMPCRLRTTASRASRSCRKRSAASWKTSNAYRFALSIFTR